MILQYTTLGEQSPLGKPRVYVSCHPRAFSAIYPRLSRQLLEMADCALYYGEPEAPMDPELSRELPRMQLLVVAVTADLLTQPCRAMEELELAKALHIPVLAILAEPGLSSLYSRKLGDLPCLSPFDRDTEQRTFREELQEILSWVLISPEQSRQIHAAFQGTAFLACLPEDREAGLSLISRLRQLDFAADLSVLTDWEPTKESAAAIRQADLILLAVTPGLLKAGNPVEKILYPAARAADKPILPVLLSDTDTESLNTRYPRLPLCVSPDQLPESLRRKLTKSKKLPHDRDPRQDYQMGLAFLSGTGLEVDRQRSVGLLRRSAQAGSREALKKLGTLYALGDGVPRDPEQALQCFRSLEDQTRQAAEARTGDVNRIFPYLDALYDLGRVCFHYGRTEEAQAAHKRFFELTADIIPGWEHPEYTHKLLSVCTGLARMEPDCPHWDPKALELGKLLCRQEPGPDSTRRLARLADAAAEHLQARQQYNLADQACREAVSLWEALAEDPREEQDQMALARCLSRRARLLMKAGDLAAPEALLHRALELSRDHPGEAWKFHCLLGEHYARKKDRKAAEEALSQALALCRDQAEKEPGFHASRCLLECAGNLGRFLISLQEPSRLPDAEASLQEAVSAAGALLETTADPEYQEALARLYTDLARISLCRQQRDSFREYLQNALARKDPSQPDWLHDFLSGLLPCEEEIPQALSLLDGAREPVLIRCQALLLLRQASGRQGQPALSACSQALSLQQSLEPRQISPDLRWETAQTQRELSRIHIENGDPQAAGQAFAACEALLLGLAQEDGLPGDTLAQASAQYIHRLQKADFSHRILEDGPRLLSSLQALPAGSAVSQGLAEVSYGLASAAMTTGSAQTQAYLAQAQALARDREALDHLPGSAFPLVRILFLTGNFCAEKEPEKAGACYEEALSLAEKPLGSGTHPDPVLALYGDLFRTCGDFFQAQGDPHRALQLYGKSVSSLSAIARQTPESIANTAQAYLAQGSLLLHGEDPDACIPSFRSTVALRRSLLPQIPEPRKLRFSLDLARDQNVLALQLFCRRQYEEAVALYENTVSLLEPFAAEPRLPRNMDYLAVAYCSLGWILGRADYWPQGITARKEKRALGKQWYRKAEDLYRRLLRQYPQGGYRTGARDTCRNLTALSRLQGNTLAAAFYRKRARRYQS